MPGCATPVGENGVMTLPEAAIEAIAAELVTSVSTDAGSPVGDFVDILEDGPGLYGVQFACTLAGYVGWRWTVSVSLCQGQTSINDIVLLPGADAIVAPAWTPYKERVKAEDLGPGDVLPPDADDIRLVPAWSAGDGDRTGVVDRHFAREIGLGREWVLSLEGREDAADRWYDGPQGPESPIAQAASSHCGSCGFLVSLAGRLADRFGVCANRMSRSDGHVVALRHGCGAHSGTRPKRSVERVIELAPIYDTVSDDDLDAFEVAPSEAESAATEPAATESAEVESTLGEGPAAADAVDSAEDAQDTAGDGGPQPPLVAAHPQ
jgi:hypothetical protein